MKMRDLQNRIKKVTALALCAGCLVGVCSQSISAATTSRATIAANEIQLTYLETSEGSASQGAFILTGRPVKIQMDIGNYALPDTDALSIKQGEKDFPKTNYGLTSTSTQGSRTVQELTVNDTGDVSEHVTLSLSGNVSTVTPPQGGYTGSVRASNGAGGDAFLTKSRVINTESQIVLVCETGQSLQQAVPVFSIKKDSGTGIFAGYTTVALLYNQSKLDNTKPMLAGRKIVFDITGGGDALTLEFEQPCVDSHLHDALDDALVDQSGSKKDANGNVYISETAPIVTNNYFRHGVEYTFTFNAPRSNLLQLDVASPRYVANDIAVNIAGDPNRKDPEFIKLEGTDTLEGLIAGKTITLASSINQYNAIFGIEWLWVPDNWSAPADDPTASKPADYDKVARSVVSIPSLQNATKETEVAAVVTHDWEDDISGTLYAVVKYNGVPFALDAKDPGQVPLNNSLTVPIPKEGDSLLPDTAAARELAGKTVVGTSFRLTIRGRGIPATVTPSSWKWPYKWNPTGGDNGTGAWEERPMDQTVLPPKQEMDVFKGDVPGYMTVPVGPYEYTLELNMGLKNARSDYAIVKVDSEIKDVLELRRGNELYTPGSRIENLYGGQFDSPGLEYLTLVAKNKGTATVTVEFYVTIGGRAQVDSTHTIEIDVRDTSPSTDSTLRSLAVRDKGNEEPAETYEYGFTSANVDYSDRIIELPYAYDTYTITPVVNDNAIRNGLIHVTATDLNGNEAKIMQVAGATDPVSEQDVKSTNPVTIKIDRGQVGEVYRLFFEVTAQDPRVKSRYEIRVQRVPPSTDDTLSTLAFYPQDDTDGKNNYLKDFNPDSSGPYIIDIPYGTKKLRVSAIPNFKRAQVTYSVDLESLTLLGRKEYLDVLSDKLPNDQVPGYDTGVTLPHFQVKVTPESELVEGGDLAAHATRTYEIFFNRLPPSEESRLSALTVVNAADDSANPRALSYTPGFGRDNEGPYRLAGALAVPYSTKAVRFKVTPMDPTISGIYIYAKPVKNDPLPQPSEEPEPSESPDPSAEPNPSESPDPSAQPSANPSASPSASPSANPTESPDPTAPVPPAAGTATGLVQPAALFSGGLRAADDEWQLITEITNTSVYSKPVNIAPRNNQTGFVYNEIAVLVVSEAGTGMDPLYFLSDEVKPEHENYASVYRFEIERNPPSTDADMTGLVTKGDDGKEIKLYAFHRDETHYEFTVPYETRKVSFNPKTSDANAKVVLKASNDLLHNIGIGLDKLTPGSDSKLYTLGEPGSPVTFELTVQAEAYEVWPEAQYTKTYTVTIDREPPSTDARLKRLAVDGITEDGLTPTFKASQLSYSATVAMGAEGVTITPTANEPHASIKVNGEFVESGSPSELIELVDEHTIVPIVVTAQDGRTTMTYTIDFFNPNVVDLTDNADLADLRIERGLMTPEFEPAVINYEVAVKEDTYSVDVIPTPADPLATVRVLDGSREMGDYNNNYALALKDGANTVVVEVTSPDGTQVKQYTATIYRNEEEQLKNLTPLTAEDLGEEIFKDQSVNPIIISVVEYPRIHSDVFQALKDATVEDPDKTIVLQGNDFSLTFRGSDLDTVIPTREIYDFSMSFSSPDEDRISALINADAGNADLTNDVVRVYFDYHGDLPGTATLNVALGNRYGSQPIYWHYFNRDRNRIDYYGTVRSNAQGTIAVRIDHFSTYLASRNHRIAGSEDHSGGISLSVSSLGAGGKLNPQTRIEEIR